jgi:hypothetical protein
MINKNMYLVEVKTGFTVYALQSEYLLWKRTLEAEIIRCCASWAFASAAQRSEREELSKLRRENRRLRLEREILKISC